MTPATWWKRNWIRLNIFYRHEIDYLNEKYFLSIPESEEYDTLAGYIIFHYESIPEKHTAVELDNFLITITDVSSNRIEEVELKVIHS